MRRQGVLTLGQLLGALDSHRKWGKGQAEEGWGALHICILCPSFVPSVFSFLFNPSIQFGTDVKNS